MNSASTDSHLSPHALLEAQNTQVSFEARPQSSAFPLWGYYLFKQMYKRSLQRFTCSFGVSFLNTTPRVSHVSWQDRRKLKLNNSNNLEIEVTFHLLKV